MDEPTDAAVRIMRLLGAEDEVAFIDTTLQGINEQGPYSALLAWAPDGYLPLRTQGRVIEAAHRKLGPGGCLAFAFRSPPFWMGSALQRAGYSSMRSYRILPTLRDPRNIIPERWRLTWPLTGHLVIASTQASAELPLLEELRAFGLFDGGFDRILTSDKGKTLVFGRHNKQRVVARVPHSAAAKAGETNAYEVLVQLHEHTGLSDLLPRPERFGNGPLAVYVENMIEGEPLALAISPSRRPAYATEVDKLLGRMNPVLDGTCEPVFECLAKPLLDRLATTLGRPHWVTQLTRCAASELAGVRSKLGVVHGDLSVGNLLVRGERLCGLIDWESSRMRSPPELDALNYLDSVERHCSRVSLVETIPKLASGQWSVPEEWALLRSVFGRTGSDWANLKGFVLLYWLFHVVPQLQFASRQDATYSRIETVARSFIASSQVST